jgi:hypothetical protein
MKCTRRLILANLLRSVNPTTDLHICELQMLFYKIMGIIYTVDKTSIDTVNNNFRFNTILRRTSELLKIYKILVPVILFLIYV